MDEILVDEEGYKQYFEELDKLKNLRLLIAVKGGEACKEAVGDGWHDNFAYEEAMREERNMASRIEQMLKEQKLLKIVKKRSMEKNIVNIGDTVKLAIQYDEDDIEIEFVKLTGKYKTDTDLEIKEISLNSPIGKAIFGKKINSSVSCVVNGKEISVNILEKLQ